MQTANPHDRLFRRVFSDPEHTSGLLRSVLPSEVASRIDWASLAHVPTTFLDEALSDLCADLVFTVRLDQREAYVYVLLEHQSTSDRLMPFRMLRYMVRLWDKHLEKQPGSALLPPIIPVIVHHSARGWKAPKAFSALVDLSPELLPSLSRHLPSFELFIDDLSDARDEDLRKRTLTDFAALTLFCLARARTSADFLSELGRWFYTLLKLVEAENGVEAARTLVSYIQAVTDAQPKQVREFFGRLGPRGEEAYMTGAEILRQEGRAEGQASLLLRLLSIKFGPLAPEIEARVRSAAVPELEHWAERVLDAQTLDGVFES